MQRILNKHMLLAAGTVAVFGLIGCDKSHDEPGGDNPRIWSSPLKNPEKPKTDEDYDGKVDPVEPVTPDQLEGQHNPGS